MQDEMSFTVVLGVDKKHLSQLQMVLPTWKKHKPSLFSYPMLIFYDREQLTANEVHDVVISYGTHSTKIVPWPPKDVAYEKHSDSKWDNPTRVRMLSGFIHIPPEYVKTKYWLKIDTDVIALENDDWIEDEWLDSGNMIIGHPWGYSVPPNQMLQLDEWVEEYNVPVLRDYEPLKLKPKEGYSKLWHKRISSWVCFFNTEFTKLCSNICEEVCGLGKMPCSSQDGTMFYFSKRMKKKILRENMKKRGWTHRNTTKQIRRKVAEATCMCIS